MKERSAIIRAADEAARAGAYRYCMAFSGRFLSERKLASVADTVRRIRKRHPKLDLCVSAGFLDDKAAALLKRSGVGRYNHNLNTSADRYADICSTHGYEDRLATIRTARKSGLEVCSGVIIGMGEMPSDIVRMCRDLAMVKAAAVPVNFFIPVKGNRIIRPGILDPQKCLKILCAFRLALPRAEIRAAAGREYHLRSLQPLCLYPANSLFARGYLTAGGDDVARTMAMISDAGFVAEKAE
jgi:biotin synthase